jgi:NAD(P)-dependent dehydrogenase (short-subunit alcohol dehydrogenase family)
VSKFTLSNNYIDEQKSEHPAQVKKSNRRAIVVGSDFTSNIGFHIGNKFTENGIHVKSFNKNIMDMISNYLPINEDDDILVLANGYTYLDWIENLNDSQISQMINDTFLASVRATNQFVQKTIKTHYKKYIIFIGSMAYKNVLNGSSVYCASKAAISHFSKCIAWELAPKGYNVVTINPSNTEGTPMTEETIRGLMRYRNLTEKEAKKYWGATLPKHNWLQPEEIADICSFFISGKADYMSGTQIDLAGGQR